MTGPELLEQLRREPAASALATALGQGKVRRIHIGGGAGSLHPLLIAAVRADLKGHHVLLLQDREEAAFFYDDLRSLLGPREDLLFFPTSYKKPYHFVEIDNANVLQRSEVLGAIQAADSSLIITYPEALSEKVLAKRSLVKNTFHLKVGEAVDVEFLNQFLLEHGFEKVDFVYEPGQFAVRGGIVDVYSFAHEWPYRIELLGEEVESLRSFDPETQLSQDNKKTVSILPDWQGQESMQQERRESLFEFLGEAGTLWMKDYAFAEETVGRYYRKAVEEYENLRAGGKENALITEPDNLFVSQALFRTAVEAQPILEFGKRKSFPAKQTIALQAEPQPSFAKDLEQVALALADYQHRGYQPMVAGDNPRQLDRLIEMIAEHEPELRIDRLDLALQEGFIDHETRLVLFTEHQLFDRYRHHGAVRKVTGRRALTLREIHSLQAGDYVTHIDHGIGRFAGIEKVEVNGRTQEAIRLIYRDNDVLLVSILALHKISRYASKDNEPPQMSKLGSGEWDTKKNKVKKRVRELAFDLIQLYAKRKAAPGYPYPQDGYLQAAMESTFPFADTPDQQKATLAVKQDMEAPNPMDRLVCGDVGFGKTEIAIRAAFKAVTGGKQVAVLVPTTVLAMQHYNTFKKRLDGFPVRVDYLSRFRTAADTKDILARTKAGEIDILIGTHKLVGAQVQFKDLGLLVVDEEQKFGVSVKEKIKTMKVNVDVLTLTATPIPRTLQFSLMGARDLSMMTTPPQNRQPVTTEVHAFDEAFMRDAIRHELGRGGQAFVVHNRIADIESLAATILHLVPDAKVQIAHGQMQADQLEKAMLAFISGEADVLVSTNIIESGLDIPNANTILINRAHMYGLSDLHQMRGRVGRSNQKAYCYLIVANQDAMTADARKRLQALEEFTELGDGLKIAMRDLDLRGAGDLLGAEQSGFIHDLGMETYHQLLDEAIGELKETEFKELFSGQLESESLTSDCQIETDLEVLLPDTYVSDISERLRLYNRADRLESTEQLEAFETELRDRFGPLPPEAEALCESIQLRWTAERLGFHRLRLKNEKLRAYVPTDKNDRYFQSPVFERVLAYLQAHPRICSMEDRKGQMILTIAQVKSIPEAQVALRALETFSVKSAASASS